LVFIILVFGVSGFSTSQEGISGLVGTLGNDIIRLGFIFGIITTFTSFLTLGLSLKKILWYDLNLPPKFSWFLACFFPLFLFLIGMRQFIDVIGLVGALAIGFDGLLIVFLYKAFLKKKFSKKMNPLFYALPIFFILGITFEFFYFLSR